MNNILINLSPVSFTKEPTIEWSTREKLHPGRLQPYPEALDYVGKACQGKTQPY